LVNRRDDGDVPGTGTKDITMAKKQARHKKTASRGPNRAPRRTKRVRTRGKTGAAGSGRRKVARAARKTGRRKKAPKPRTTKTARGNTAARRVIVPRSKAPSRVAKNPRARPPLIRQARRKQEVFKPESDTRMLSAARAGHDDLRAQLAQHTEASPAMTAGDVDAKWQDAYAIGDEAPGGDNPTPGQDRVDDIGKALGIQYQDAQELQGGDEVTERDHHRWELDPASSDDWPRDKKKK
jgi:hypothetical protein